MENIKKYYNRYFKIFLTSEKFVILLTIAIFAFTHKYSILGSIKDENLTLWGITFKSMLEIGIHIFVSLLASLFVVVGFVFLKSIILSYPVLLKKDSILQSFIKYLLEYVFVSKDKIEFSYGFNETLSSIQSVEGALLGKKHFIAFLKISADFEPHRMVSAWNLVWYPIEDVFVQNDDGIVEIKDEWKEYFDSLNKVYKNSRGKSIRFFLVKSIKDIKDVFEKKEGGPNWNLWKKLLTMHIIWGIDSIRFIEFDEFKTKISTNHLVPNLYEFVIFNTTIKYLYNKKWIVGQTDDQNNNQRIAFLGKKDADNLEKFITTTNWNKIIYGEIDRGAEKIIIKNGELLESFSLSDILFNNWKIASQIYHSDEEYNFLKTKVLGNFHGKAILDASCGTGFPLLNLKADGHEITGFDIDPNCIDYLQKEKNVDYTKVKHYSFQQLKIKNNIESKFDLVFSIGASLTYCDSWSIGKTDLNKKSIKKSLKGLRNILKEDGELIIGNSKIYETIDRFYFNKFEIKEIEGSKYEMIWNIDFNHKKELKTWVCRIYKISGDNSKKLHSRVELVSHLITKRKLIKYCKKYFKNIEVVEDINPNIPEYYIKCKKK